MNAEELELYKKLQPLFVAKMGPWREGDWYYDVKAQERDIYEPPMDMSDLSGPVLRLPLPIDPVNPERGLWGMIDWMHASVTTIGLSGDLRITISNPRSPVSWKNFEGQPTLALLKALEAQTK